MRQVGDGEVVMEAVHLGPVQPTSGVVELHSPPSVSPRPPENTQHRSQEQLEQSGKTVAEEACCQRDRVCCVMPTATNYPATQQLDARPVLNIQHTHLMRYRRQEPTALLSMYAS